MSVWHRSDPIHEWISAPFDYDFYLRDVICYYHCKTRLKELGEDLKGLNELSRRYDVDALIGTLAWDKMQELKRELGLFMGGYIEAYGIAPSTRHGGFETARGCTVFFLTSRKYSKALYKFFYVYSKIHVRELLFGELLEDLSGALQIDFYEMRLGMQVLNKVRRHFLKRGAELAKHIEEKEVIGKKGRGGAGA